MDYIGQLIDTYKQKIKDYTEIELKEAISDDTKNYIKGKINQLYESLQDLAIVREKQWNIQN